MNENLKIIDAAGLKRANPRAAEALIEEGRRDERRRAAGIRRRAAGVQADLTNKLIADGVSLDAATLVLLRDLRRREFEALPIEERIARLWDGSEELRAAYRGQRDSFGALYRVNSKRATGSG